METGRGTVSFDLDYILLVSDYVEEGEHDPAMAGDAYGRVIPFSMPVLATSLP